MTKALCGFVTLTVFAVLGSVWIGTARSGRAADEAPAAPKPVPALTGSAVSALLDANGGKPPATGKELWRALSKLGQFAQLPVVFSAVRLDSGINNPRVVITPVVNGLSEAGVTKPNLNGRLFLAANMEKDPSGGDPRVTSVEFISWNTLRQKFDFGVIEGMGDDPRLTIVDGGRCFSCHKNKGPILSARPWTNSTHHVGLRTLVTNRLKVVETVPAGAAGVGLRDRIDGMALAAPEGDAVDNSVRRGALQRVNRETFRLMNLSDGGRKAFTALLLAIVQPGAIHPTDRQARMVLEQWGNEPSYVRFTTDWVSMAKATNSGVLIDFAPIPKPLYHSWGSRAPAAGTQTRLAAAQQFANELTQLATADAARAAGKQQIPSSAQPSNPKAFVSPQPKAAQHPSEMVTAALLANTIGLTEGDRQFMADALAGAARRRAKQKVTAATLAKDVFTGAEFSDVLAGGPLPDRDDFKDRFVAGLNTVLTTRYQLESGFAPERREYASGPRRDPKALDEIEAATVPTSACLRCHDVRAGAKGRLFEPIPALAFDPFDKTARAEWVRTADPKRKREVLTRLAARLHSDADMPPQDAPEYELFRVQQAAAFDDLKVFLATEQEKVKKP